VKVVVEQASKRLDFRFEPDALDAPPPLERVWFRFDRWVRTDAARLSLLAFALVENLIGNRFTLEGVEMPAHLAAALQHRFAGHELFIQGISNEARLLGRDFERELMLGPQPEASEAEGRHLRVARTELGFEFHDGDGELLGRWASNLPLHLALVSPTPGAALQTALYLLAYDAFLVRAMPRPAERNLSLDCLVEVGGELR
jgi:hypothetical protein